MQSIAFVLRIFRTVLMADTTDTKRHKSLSRNIKIKRNN